MRPTKEQRREEIARAALDAFTDKGYRMTQVADVARLARVAAGTIYLFANSKEDLFWLALRFSLGKPLDDDHARQITADDLRAEFASQRDALRLREAIENGGIPTLEEVLRNHWDVVSRSAHAIKLVERCAQDWPQLAVAFYGDLRKTVVQDLATYLRLGAEHGICRSVAKPDVAARLIIETIAWFAMHRLGDADGRNISDSDARDTTFDALLHAYGAVKP